MNPIAFTFVPRASPINLSYEDATTALHALTRSLASEQRAHRDTQLVLGSAHTRIAELEASLEEISKQNKQLLSKVNMMGSIIKHNQHKARDEEWTPVKPKTPHSLDEGSPIIHDVLAKRLADKAERGGSETDVNSSVQVNDTERELNDIAVFNIDSIRNSDDITIRRQFDSPRSLEHSEDVTPRPTRQYYDSSEEGQTGRLSQVVTPLKKVNKKLISFSPDELDNGKKCNAVIAISERLQQETAATPAQQDTVAVSTTSTSPPRDKVSSARRSTSTEMLTLAVIEFAPAIGRLTCSTLFSIPLTRPASRISRKVQGSTEGSNACNYLC
jgi:hypothetical protein